MKYFNLNNFPILCGFKLQICKTSLFDCLGLIILIDMNSKPVVVLLEIPNTTAFKGSCSYCF